MKTANNVILVYQHKYAEWIEELGNEFLINVLAQKIADQESYIEYLERRLEHGNTAQHAGVARS